MYVVNYYEYSKYLWKVRGPGGEHWASCEPCCASSGSPYWRNSGCTQHMETLAV